MRRRSDKGDAPGRCGAGEERVEEEELREVLIWKVVSKPSGVHVAPVTTCRPALSATASTAGSESSCRPWTPSLREQRKLRTGAAITAAALDLFAARGYDAVTVAEVAAAAGVGERTLYRYFADKEDLLLAEDEAWRAALRAAIDEQPAGVPPFTVLQGASATVVRALEERQEEVRRRSEVIASAPALTARERAKHAAWEEVLAAGLRERGVAEGEARLLGRIAVACYDEALTRWLAHDGPRRPLAAELDATFAQVVALAG